MKRVLAASAGGVLLLAGIVWALPNESDFRGIPASSHSASPSGAKALYRFFGGMGLEVRRWEERDYQGLPDGTLWILNRTPISHLHLKGLEVFLERGNTIIGSFQALEPLLKEEHLGDLTREDLDTRAPEVIGGKVLDSSDSHGITGDPEPDRVFATGKRNANAPARNVIAGWHAGKGEVVILGADDIVRNDEIGLAENGPFLLDLAHDVGRKGHRVPRDHSAPGHPQIFDEVGTGISTKSFGALLVELPYRLGLLQAGLAFILLLLVCLPRRAPVDPVPAHRRRTTVEHLDAVARLWGRSRDPGLPVQEILAAVNERSRHASATPFADWVASRRPDLGERAGQAVKRAVELSELNPAGPPALKDALAAAAVLITLEGEASRW